MKTCIHFIIALFLLGFSILLQGQTSKWFVQVGGGYLAINQIEQLGFDSEGPAILAAVEVGKTFQPLSVGVQQSFFQEYVFYRYGIKQQIQTIYAKYSLNQLTDLLPYGVDPYLMAGAAFTTNRFLTFDNTDPDLPGPEGQEIYKSPGYTVGGGLQIGSRSIIFGMHYQYSPGQNSFTLSDFETLPFATGVHLFSIDMAIRLTAPSMKKHSKCPRFGGKGMLRF
jgi:hypothetical protein